MLLLKPYPAPQHFMGRLRRLLVTIGDEGASGESAAAWLCKAIAGRSLQFRDADVPVLYRARIEMTALALLLSPHTPDADRDWFLQVARCVPGCFVVAE